jgi:hypothetical protein
MTLPDCVVQEDTNDPGGHKNPLSACAHFSPDSMILTDHPTSRFVFAIASEASQNSSLPCYRLNFEPTIRFRLTPDSDA